MVGVLLLSHYYRSESQTDSIPPPKTMSRTSSSDKMLRLNVGSVGTDKEGVGGVLGGLLFVHSERQQPKVRRVQSDVKVW